MREHDYLAAGPRVHQMYFPCTKAVRLAVPYSLLNACAATRLVRQGACSRYRMPHADLQPFIDAAKDRGASDDFLASALTSRGWPARDVYSALVDWWERSLGLTLPARRSAAENARDAFLYLLGFSMLATWASALGSLWFRLIEYWLPDPAVAPYYYNFRETVTWQMASILVALPIYLFVMRLILRESAGNEERIESGVRKWLTYIALLLAATGVVCDLVCFVDYFLKGEITPRFALKCFVVLAICGSIFAYYLGFLRNCARSGIFVAAACLAAGAGLICGFTAAGTPAIQRRIEADNRRVEDLRMIAGLLAAAQMLPQNLAAMRQRDPESRLPYEYTRRSDTQYELCANFASPSENRWQSPQIGFWTHPAGHACFTLDKSRPVPW